MNDKPNEILVDKVVSIWKEFLKAPVYDNGDESFTGFMAQSLAASAPNNSDNTKIDIFGKELKKRLMGKNEYGGYTRSTSVDYGPDQILKASAAAAGLEMQFPWKTNVSFYSDYISVSAGYGSPTVQYYQLPDGRWLIVSLTGEDISKVIEYVMGGKPEFKTEEIKDGE